MLFVRFVFRFALVWFCLFRLRLCVWAAACDCGTLWTFLLPFFHINVGYKFSSKFNVLFAKLKVNVTSYFLEKKKKKKKRKNTLFSL